MLQSKQNSVGVEVEGREGGFGCYNVTIKVLPCISSTVFSPLVTQNKGQEVKALCLQGQLERKR